MLKNYIKEIRIEKELTQMELAELVGTSKNTIGNIERGKYTPRIDLAIKICNALGTSVENVFCLTEKENLP